MYDSPDRVRHPLRRRGNAWVRVSWDEALADIGARVRRLRQAHDGDAIAMYAGFSVLHPVFARGFMTGLGSRSMSLISMPNAGRLRRALDRLVTLDLYRNETGSLAHDVLPATSTLERADLPFIFPRMLGLQREPYLRPTRRVIRPDGEPRDEATIYLDPCRAAGVSLSGSRVAQAALEARARVLGSQGKLTLITRRRVTTHNSWTHDNEELGAAEGGTVHLHVHPEDAARPGRIEGAQDPTSWSGLPVEGA